MPSKAKRDGSAKTDGYEPQTRQFDPLLRFKS